MREFPRLNILWKSCSPKRRFSLLTARYVFSGVMDITASPVIDQRIEHLGKHYVTVKEGLAFILVSANNAKVPQQSPLQDSQSQDVFYNPIQQFNRDLSVLVIKAYGEQVIEQQLKKSKNKEMKRNQVKEREKKRKRHNEPLDSESLKNLGRLEKGQEESQENSVETIIIPEEPKPEPSDFDTVNLTTKLSMEDDNCLSVKEDQAGNLETNVRTKTQPNKVKFTILDALSATGLRALRYAHEIPFATSITANDLMPSATKQIKLNVLHNQLMSKISVTTENANAHMYARINTTPPQASDAKISKYNVIDLDPYGTAAPFFDAALQAIEDGGLLCITCTDAAVWASNGWPEKCYALYGGMPLKGPLSHEAGLRLILHAIATSAARYGLAVTPLLALSIDFYARIFIRVYRSALHVKFLAGKTMTVYNCDTGCGAWTTQMLGRNKYAMSKKGNEMWKHGLEQGPSAKETCAECGFKTHIGGPMYAGPLHSQDFLLQVLESLKGVDKEIYQTLPRIHGMLTVALEECLSAVPQASNHAEPILYEKTNSSPSPQYLQNSLTIPATIDPAPFFIMLSSLSKVLHTVTPHENSIRGALRHLGYRVTRSHTKGGSIKTDAPWSIIWRIMRAWVSERSPVKEGAVRENTAGWAILGLGLSPEERKTRDLENSPANPDSSDHSAKVIFDEKLGSEKDRNKLVRYQRNPRSNWGPMSRSKGKIK